MNIQTCINCGLRSKDKCHENYMIPIQPNFSCEEWCRVGDDWREYWIEPKLGTYEQTDAGLPPVAWEDE